MAVLKKPYELSLWRDIWDDTNQWFDEQKICVIGSNDMLSQSRAIEPTLTRNVNGSKKLTFKMYKKYVDTITGETVHNPFVDMLISESKIKLNYNGKWFDFIIKNIIENSSTHLCTYQLEDAFVNELSKNGFNKVLSTDLTNNMGDVNTLAKNLLDETDWRVGPTSEKIVQTVEDALVYVTIPAETTIYHLLDQKESNRTSGVIVEDSAGITLENSITALAFYTSCKNKPHRFQFIYSDKGYFTEDGEPLLSRDQERIITEADCQYYCEIDDPASYTVTQYNMSLPTGWSFSTQTHDELISSLYRGDRYGFAQKSKYIPEIDRYVYLYKKDGDNTEYYGYQYNEYNSATTVSDIITNSSFKSAAGWTGHTTEEIGEKSEVNKAKVENVYGRFNSGAFISLTDDLQNEDYEPDAQDRTYLPYLKISFEKNTDKKQIVLNSGPYDRRYSIKEMPAGSLWAVRCVDQSGTSLINNGSLNFSLVEYKYNTGSKFLCYEDTGNFRAELAKKDNGSYKTYTIGRDTYYFFEVKTNKYTSETAFTKSSEVRLAITANKTSDAIYYIKDIELFRAHYTKEDTPKLIIPNEKHTDTMLDDIKNQITFSEYRYFSKDKINSITNEKDMALDDRFETLTYKKYKPVYNNEAEKIRSVEEKESNYFNILQSLAETFECWLDIEVERDATGKIIRRKEEDAEGPVGTLKKNIVFKNYVGQKNHASFRYGVNLKDIQRTYESKNIVTKLVVKTNANEHAPNGFCTIQRAGANQTGENYIYDFGYYHNMGMLDANVYLSTIQDSTNTGNEWAGPDIPGTTGINLKGYNIRISNLNKTIQEENERLVGLAQDITKVSAQKKTAEALLDAANTGIVEVEADYERVAKQHIKAKLTADLLNRDDIKSLLVEYGTYISERDKQQALVTTYTNQYNTLKSDYASGESRVKALLEHKKALNTKFYNIYSRFIQEGTWVNEEYIDDDKYYNDAKSVLYNSCYPQVAYNVSVLALSMLPGYELLDFDLGDQTNVVDPEFFGDQFQEEVVVTETVESLDDPTKNTIKVQNFKNQFQDLFQKITATVQQTQYSTGAYQKAVSLAYAEEQAKMEFLNDALSSAGAMLTTAGQQSVTWGDEGITVTDVDTPCNEIRMVGGAILLSKQDEQTGQKKWVSAMTSDGISANLITAGVVNTGKVAIMNGNEEKFLWDANGINAFGDKDSGSGERPFVRFDKYGLYGIKDKDGAAYRAVSLDAIMNDSTFALTWEGLRVVGDSGVVRIGKQEEDLITIDSIIDGENTTTFRVKKDGSIETTGITIRQGTIEGVATSEELSVLEKQIEENKKEIDQSVDDLSEAIKSSGENLSESISNLDNAVSNYLGLGGTTIQGPEYVISPYIGGGYLHIANGKNSVTINPIGFGKAQGATSHDIFKITTVSGDAVTIDTAGNASFTGKITATSLDLTTNQVKIPTTDISGLSTVATSGNYTDLIGTPAIPTAITDLIGSENILYSTNVTRSESTTDSNGIKTSTITFGNISYKVIENEDLLLFNKGYGTQDEENHSSQYVYISKDGALIADNAVIWGKIYAGEGEIGGWHINEKAISKNDFILYGDEGETINGINYRLRGLAAATEGIKVNSQNISEEKSFSQKETIYILEIPYSDYVEEGQFILVGEHSVKMLEYDDWETPNISVSHTLSIDEENKLIRLQCDLGTNPGGLERKYVIKYEVVFDTYEEQKITKDTFYITTLGNLFANRATLKSGAIGDWLLAAPEELNTSQSALYYKGSIGDYYYYLFPDHVRVKTQGGDLDQSANWLDIVRAGFQVNKSFQNLQSSAKIITLADGTKLTFTYGILTDVI